MAFTDDGTSMVLPVAPMGNMNNGTGFGWGGDGFWIILLFLLLGNNGWGNGFGGGFANDSAAIYPWMNQSNQINGGFRDQMLNTSINGIQNSITSGFGDVQTALCGGFAGVNAGIANGFAQAEIANNARQIANMQQGFAAQTATLQGFNGVQAGQADIKYSVATENCANRAALSEGLRDVMENCNRNNQAVLDKLCQLELDGVKGQLAQAQRDNVGLQNQLNMASFRESQANQNALFAQGMSNEADALYNRLKNCPVNTVPVYGSQPIFTCGGNPVGCGCGA